MHRRVIVSLAVLIVLLAGSLHARQADRHPQAPEALDAYAFKIGEWAIEVKSMRPDQTFMNGRGALHVVWILDGYAIQENLRVRMEDGSEIRGTTLRTYDPTAAAWHIAYFQANSSTASGFGTANVVDGRLVEQWGVAEDSHGSYETTLAHDVLSGEQFRESLDRDYANGPVIRGVWQYVATRVK